MSNPSTADFGAYAPHEIEEKWYAKWIAEGRFKADPNSDKPPYSIVIPPPNVTGSLHMGHALNNTLQDALCRYKRMDGFETLWMPGTDHAGIATQNVVERMLAAEGTDRAEVGREDFIKRVWKWRDESGGTIIRQLHRLGASCDWDRERFTMDEGLSKAVREVFCKLYEEGLIYQGDYIINWCPRCQTALSDLEVEHEDAEGNIWFIRYPLENGKGSIVVGTTRPETMLGDTAVAVHPDDPRYASMIGETIILPLAGRQILIIADEAVDPEFATGAVKVTPCHDPNDFAMGNTHGLEKIAVIGEDGTMTAEAGKYAGLDRYECRKRVVEDLEALGLLTEIKNHLHAVGHCYRCRTVVEPLVSRQWFVKIKPMAREAIKAIKTGRTRIVPDNWKKTYFNWMENIRDWCISRQIWWGHRIPAFTCNDCGKLTVARIDPDACPACGSKHLTQDSDVLDTWFSSALWPFSTMGWPDTTPELKKFYPTSVLITGFDILFFWVARMMMMGIKFMDEIPFKDVYIHALVRDEHGQKMSKSKGNVIDPLEVIDKYGADAFRFTLAAFAAQGRDVKLSVDRVEGYYRFVNKLWNATRFAMMNLEDFDVQAAEIKFSDLQPQDRWILTRTKETVEEARRCLDGYEFDKAASAIYQFVWRELCDWYIEMSKTSLSDQSTRTAAQQTIIRAMDIVMRTLHPFMPFVTEELWHRLPWPNWLGNRPESLIIAPFPKPESLQGDEEAKNNVEGIKTIVSAIRNVRGEMNVPPSRKIIAIFRGELAIIDLIKANENSVSSLAGVKNMEFIADSDPKPAKAAAAVTPGLEIFMPLAGMIDFAEEKRRLKKEIEKLQTEWAKVNSKLGNTRFIQNAPATVIDKEQTRAAEITETLAKLKANLNDLTVEN